MVTDSISRVVSSWAVPRLVCAVLLAWTAAVAAADERHRSAALTPEPSSDTYNFVAHYRVQIDAPREAVWPHLLDFKSWMYEFELSTVAGTPGTEGQVLRLYAGQDFRIQVTRVVPHEMVAIVNLPMTFEGELGTGIGVMTLHDTPGGCEMALTMSRRYTWQGAGDNPLRSRRESADFHRTTDAMWQDRFLARLKALAEGTGPQS